MKINPLTSSSRVRVEATVLAVHEVTPKMRRLTLGGPSLMPLLSTQGVDAPAAWVKIFVPLREGRAYTIRRIDFDRHFLEIDVVLHGETHADDGSVSSWARYAKPGDTLEIAGPRSGGFELLQDIRWLWLAGDGSALPAIQSILERLPEDIDVHVLIQTSDQAERQLLQTQARLHESWIYTTDVGQASASQLGDYVLPVHHELACSKDRGQIWLAGEATTVKTWQQYCLHDFGMDRMRVSSKGYWKVGKRDHRD